MTVAQGASVTPLAVPPAFDGSVLRRASKRDLLRAFFGRSSAKSDAMASRAARLDLLRQLRASVQGVQTVICAIRDGRATLSGYGGYFEEARAEIEQVLDKIHLSLPDRDVAHADDIQHIANQWRALLCSPIVTDPAAATKLAVTDQVRELALCERICDDLVGRLGHLTIPARLNDWLTESWSGYLLSFHDIFSDELPNPERRQELLKLLASVPGLVQGGLVEPVNGWIFPYHRQWYRRWGTCLLLALGYLAATVAVWKLSGALLSALGKASAGDSPRLLLDWFLVVVGVVTHYAIDRSKGGNAGSKSIPLGHPTCAIDARAGIIALKGLLMLIGFFGLICLVPAGPPNHLEFLLVGYSLDSFAGIVAASLDERAAARGAELAKRAGVKV